MVRVVPLRQRAPGLAVALLALLLVAALVLPRSSARADLRPVATTRADLRFATAGRSAVTPAATAEINRVVAQSLVGARRVDARSAPTDLATAQIRCADFEGQHYCLHVGWTDRSPATVVRSAATTVARQAARPLRGRTGTGDATLLVQLRHDARRTPARQAAADRAELVQAAQAVGKVWLLRHQIQHVPLPAGFLARHPEIHVAGRPGGLAATTVAARADVSPTASPAASPASSPAAKATAAATAAATSTATPTATASPVSPTTAATVDPQTKHGRDYPQRHQVLNHRNVADQTRTYWCGPTAMQMIGWGWTHTEESQDVWASRLGTTRSGTSISAMVAVTNAYTGWDQSNYAGPYVALDVSDFTFHQWWLLLMRHVVDYRSPEILHPVLLKEYYPYLDHDESGHFQVGRGYNKRGRKANRISYFEPWNQQRFDPSEPYIARVQWRNAYKSYRANLAHFQHNIGV